MVRSVCEPRRLSQLTFVQQGGAPTKDPSRPLLHIQRLVHFSRTKHPAFPYHDSHIRYSFGRQTRGRAHNSGYGLRKIDDGLGALGILRRPATVEYVPQYLIHVFSHPANNG